MADEAVRKDEPETGTAPRRTGAILAVVAAAVLGSGAGVALVGPMAAGRLAAPAVEKAEADDHGGGKGGGHGGGHGAAGDTYTMENLVLNPAGTQGTRFLMATIVARVRGASAADALMGRDAEARDRLMALLGSRTVDELTDVTRREGLKEEIRGVLGEMVGESAVEAVYLPTFVIQ